MFGNKKHIVEHAINIYASSFFTMPANCIYEPDVATRNGFDLKNYHIYMIGSVPQAIFVSGKLDGSDLAFTFDVLGDKYEVRRPMLEITTFTENAGRGTREVSEAGYNAMLSELLKQRPCDFEVLYIGQAYGESGQRNALDRLKKHETLQKISLQGVPAGYELNILMLEILPATRMITSIGTWGNDEDRILERLQMGREKLNNTSEAERVTLFEASFIRYFQPKYNVEFKNSFPSTNMKTLKDCYEKDIATIIAEISFDELPYKLFSPTVGPRPFHIAHHDLHDDEARKVFFAPY